MSKFNFKKLNAARIKRGHSVLDAVHEMGISYPLYYKWMAGGVVSPRRLSVEAVERYIKKAERL